MKKSKESRALLDAIHAGEQEEIRLRAAMMAAVDEGVGMLFEALERTGQLDNTFIIFLGDNGYFFGEHGLGPGAALRLRGRHTRAVHRALSEAHQGRLAPEATS